jgi:hypothetical protein
MLRLILAIFPTEEIEEKLFKSQEPKIPLKIKKIKNISAHRKR